MSDAPSSPNVTLEPSWLPSAKAAMVTVGSTEGAGRGFVVEARRRVLPVPGLPTRPFVTNRLIITAAHCLPFLPPAHPASFTHERTYPAIIAALGDKPAIAAECCFVDPIADVAVLQAPDGQSPLLCDDAEAYDELVDGCTALSISAAVTPCDAWLLTLGGQWERCGVRVSEGSASGASGSPIVTADGRVVGVVSLGTEVSGQIQAEQYGQPRLASVLPVWLMNELIVLSESDERVDA